MSKAFDRLNHSLAASIHPQDLVSPSLADVHYELMNVRDGLKKLRNEIMFNQLTTKVPASASMLVGQLQGGEVGGEVDFEGREKGMS